MSFVTVLVKKLFGVLFSIVGLFKKLLCFLNIKRGRKNSGTILPMHSDPVANSVPQSVPSNDEVELESWDNWVEGGNNNPAGYDPNPAATAAANRRPAYLMKPVLLSNQPEPEPEPDVDFFEDMTPQIRKTAKILVKKKEEYNGVPQGLSSRLAMSSDVHLSPIDSDTAAGDAGTWQDDENGWGEEAMEDLSWQAETALREKRRQERERKISEHQKRKADKEMMRGERGGGGGGGQFSAVKLS